MEATTPDKQEVLAIAGRMGWDDPDMAVGKLFRVWRWFDQQTIGGNAPGVTLALLDRISGVSGFGLAMQSVGWLIVTDAGISLPNFDRHCGKTAKDRALTANRVANHKASKSENDRSSRANVIGNGKGNGTSVSGALPREEKRRSKPLAPPAGVAEMELPEWLSPTDWQRFIDHRVSIKHPLTVAAAKVALNRLAKLRAGGNNPVDLIDAAVLNEWRGFFEPLYKKTTTNGQDGPRRVAV